MQLDLTPEQHILRDSTRGFLARECPIGVVRELADDPSGFDRAWWRRGAALGWTSLLVPEELGGGSVSGQGLLDLALVAEEMGAMVSPGPLVPTNVVAAALANADAGERFAPIISGILAGESIAAWCVDDPSPGGFGSTMAARRDGDGYRITGGLSAVEAAAQSDILFVVARTLQGPTQFVVPRETPGVIVTPLNSIDLVRRFAAVQFDNVPVPSTGIVGTVGDAAANIERQLDIAVVLGCAESVGATQRVLDLTLSYMSDRYTFGRPLASYQALKHRVADMKMWLEACHASATGAARAVQAMTEDAAEMVSVAKSFIGDHTVEIVQDCVQMHGGIGVTWEHDLHLYLRRVTLNRGIYGTPEVHRERVAMLIGL